MGWYSANYQYRQLLYTDPTKIDATIVDMPVMVKLDSGNFDFTQAQADADDVVFTDSDKVTLLSHLIDDWDNVGELGQAWVKVPQIDAGSITDSIYVYWGNATATNTESPEFVFGGYETINNCESRTIFKLRLLHNNFNLKIYLPFNSRVDVYKFSELILSFI